MRTGLTTRQLARLGELLDLALPMSPEARRSWLASLPEDDGPLVQPLRAALLADDPAAATDRAFPGPHGERFAGERLGAYELLQPLGAGGMAEVWLARRADGVFERQVALKIPRLGYLPTEMADRFARECRILATLEYPRIARLYDAGVVSGLPYIAMEYVQGEPLIDWCNSRGLDAAARERLFLQVLDAVGHAHTRGIIHRDLKPSNILITAQGEVRLLDFGVASLLQANSEPRSLTQIYGRALTPEYASPELLRGDPIDVRSDIYSLGVVLHELLTGARPGPQGPAPGLRAILDPALAAAPADRYPDVAAFAAALQRESKDAPGATRRSRYVITGAAVLAVLALATIYWANRRPESPPHVANATAQQAPTAIAVLPFVDLSERRDHAYLSDGLAEELIDLLTKIPELRVTARASSFAFRDRKVDAAEIGRQLNVAHILEGSVRVSGDRLKFTVQLIRAQDGTAIWSDTYDRELQDIFEIQESVATAVVEALKLQLLADHGVAAERRTANVRAYAEYLVGRQYRDGISLERQRHAQAAFERAAALDPGFAPAHAGVALAAADIGSMTMTSSSYDLALAEAERAMQLAPRLTEAYVARAHVRTDRNWDYVGAKADLDAAMALDPNNMELLQAYASYLWMTGQVEEALDLQRRNVTRNPLASTAWDWLGIITMDARDYPGARQAFARGAELSPYSDYRLLMRTLVEIYAGNGDEALRLARSNPDPNWRDYTLSMAAFSAGSSAEADAALQGLIARVPDQAAAQIAFAYAWRGERDQTFAWLERAIAIRDPGLKGIRNRPEFDRLRDDPRFTRVLRLMNLPD